MGKPCNAATYRKATFDLAVENSPKIVVEVGVYEGALSKMLATLPTLEQLHVVDSWDGYYSRFGDEHMEKVAASVMSWAAGHPKVTIHRMDSSDAVALFSDEAIDFFHTDGDHSLAGVRRDLRMWAPKVKAGGILSGDNYEAATVAKGVDEAFPQRELLANGRLWWVRK